MCGAINTFAPTVVAHTPSACLQTDQTHSVELIVLLEQLLTALDQDNPAVVEPLLLKLEGQSPKQALAEIQAKLSTFDFRGSETLALDLLNKIKTSTDSK